MPATKRLAGIKNKPIRNTLLVCALAAVVIFWTTKKLGYYTQTDFWQNLVAGMHNTLFDVILISVLLLWLNKRSETRIEIQRYREEIDAWKSEASSIALKRIPISIKRLNEQGIYDMDLSDGNLQGVNLSGLLLAQSNLSGGNLYEAKFEGTDLSDAILIEANLKNTNFTNAILCGATLRKANLQRADMQWANIKGADFTYANVAGVNWKNALYDGKTKFPYDFDKTNMIYFDEKVSAFKLRLQRIKSLYRKHQSTAK